MKKDILKLGLSLAIYAGIACSALTLVYAMTAPTIAGLEQKQLDELFIRNISAEELESRS